MVVNPVSGKVYVANTEARQRRALRGARAPSPATAVRGHLAREPDHRARPGGGSVAPRHLNKHIDYAHCCAPIPNAENAKSLAFPTGMAVTGDGATLYVAALGSSKVGVFATAQLENDTLRARARRTRSR